MNYYCSILKRSIIALFFMVAVGITLNCAAFLLPQDRIHDNIVRSGETFLLEGGFPGIVKDYDISLPDNNMDAWSLLIADYNDPKDPMILKALAGKYASYPVPQNGLMGVDNLPEVHTGSPEKVYSYNRYWHGWLFPLRLLLCFFYYSDIRVLDMFVMTGLFSAVMLGMQKKELGALVFPLTVSFLAMMPVTLPLCFSYMTSLIIALSMLLALLYKREQIEKHLYVPVFFLIGGAVTSYTEFLVFPILTLGWPLTLYIITLQKERKDWKEQLKMIAVCSIAWAFGYFGMWASKWIVTDLLTDLNSIRSAYKQIRIRSSATSDLKMQEQISRFKAVYINLKRLYKRPFVALFTLSVLYYFTKPLRRRTRNAAHNEKCCQRFMDMLMLWLIAAMPLVWWFLTANHSWIHSHFTYRAAAVMIFAGLCSLRRMTE